MPPVIPHVLLTLTLIAVSLLLGATVYESVVMAPNYERDVPASIEAARRFLVKRTPAHFFRALTPAAQILALASTIAAWTAPASGPPATWSAPCSCSPRC